MFRCHVSRVISYAAFDGLGISKSLEKQLPSRKNIREREV